MFEGKPVGTPDAGVIWRVCEQFKVKGLFIAPTAVRGIKKEDSEAKLMQRCDLSHLKAVHVAGERCDPHTIKWMKTHLAPGVLINDNWWQTETGWPITTNFANLETFETVPGSSSLPCPGYKLKIIGESGREVEGAEMGEI
mmetsp:Transcript_80314/g.173640  ORF Transcript_80314/g.173640 Transcript_80314/m.173640 type:complete len:141 (-) Transcript_80314:2188-2610(-)